MSTAEGNLFERIEFQKESSLIFLPAKRNGLSKSAIGMSYRKQNSITS
jgi:hypothetical protein